MLQIPTSLKSAPEALNSPAAIKAYDDFAAAAARDSFWTYRKHMPQQTLADDDFFLEGGAMKFIEKSAIITGEYWVRVY